MNSSQSKSTLRNLIKRYQKRVEEIKTHLEVHPEQWGKFQSEFNQEVNSVFRDLMIFEKENLAAGNEDIVYKLKKFFEKHFRKEFARGQYIKHSLEKPYGYAGDFQIIDWIYLNHSTTTGFDRLFDNYFLESPASVATRNRKEDFKRIIHKFLAERNWEGDFLDLASGPCRDIYELMKMDSMQKEKVRFTCLDSDLCSIEYAKKIMNGEVNAKFIHENVVRLALKKDIVTHIGKKFDMIFSTGLFDYLEEKLAIRLMTNLKKILKNDGLMVISNYLDKYSNPSIHFMELAGDWNLVYRTEDEFAKIFTKSGFDKESLHFEYEQQGIMQYCFAEDRK